MENALHLNNVDVVAHSGAVVELLIVMEKCNRAGTKIILKSIVIIDEVKYIAYIFAISMYMKCI